MEPAGFASLSSTRPTWVVDIRQQCLVKTKPTHEYAALSYVWGEKPFFKTLREHLKGLQISHALSPTSGLDIPQTIRDAMGVAGSMGTNYLWVDCLCIIQDDEKHKHAEITSMAAIFSNASFTIIASSGKDAAAGLPGFPGITVPRLVQQEIFALKWGRCMVKLQRPRSRLSWRDTQPWGRRAWTVQEHIFSKRRLIYEDGWIRWHCSRATWQEDSTASQVGNWPNDGISDDVWGDLQSIRKELGRNIPNVQALADSIRHFVRAELTFPEDVLDSFAGLATALEPCYEGGFVSGLPAAFFYIAILWSPFDEMRRRRAKDPDCQLRLPTWSWAGWQGDVCAEAWDAAMDFAIQPGNGIYRSIERISPLFEWKYHETLEDGGKLLPNIWYNARQKFCSNEQDEPCPNGWTRHNLSESQVSLYDEEIKFLNTRPQHVFRHQSETNAEFRYPLPLQTYEQAPLRLRSVPYISCSSRRAYLRVDMAFRDLSGNENAVLRDDAGTWLGILTLTGSRTLDRGGDVADAFIGSTVEVVEVACGSSRIDRHGNPRHYLCPELSLRAYEMPTNGPFYEYYYVMWVEWEGRVAYRKGIGRVVKERWESLDRDMVELMLG
ncbi:hypothetical protein HJFPF1_13104 [Paramyrothecium foliicola]|nr:hypothetical protein HJFPF1_13104 [Paramyrothecium foliicola]